MSKEEGLKIRTYAVFSLECERSEQYEAFTPEAAVEKFHRYTGITGKVEVYSLNKVGEFCIESHKLVITGV